MLEIRFIDNYICVISTLLFFDFLEFFGEQKKAKKHVIQKQKKVLLYESGPCKTTTFFIMNTRFKIKKNDFEIKDVEHCQKCKINRK